MRSAAESHSGLEMFAKLGESADNQQLLVGWRSVQFFVFENPGVAVRNEYGVQSSSECRIDIGFRTVPDHPGGMVRAVVLVGDVRVDLGVFFGHNLDRGKIAFHSGSVDLPGL